MPGQSVNPYQIQPFRLQIPFAGSCLGDTRRTKDAAERE